MWIAESLERFLWRRGFVSGPVRRTAKVTILLAVCLLLAGTVLLPFAFWPFWLGFGALLSAWNFYSLARGVLAFLPVLAASSRQAEEEGEDAKARTGAASRTFLMVRIFQSNLRLFITGILVYSALVVWHASPFALAAGLSLAVIVAPVLLLTGRRG